MTDSYIRDDEGLIWPLLYDEESKTWASEFGEAPFVVVNYIEGASSNDCVKCHSNVFVAAIIREDQSHECLDCALVPQEEVEMAKKVDYVLKAMIEAQREEDEGEKKHE